MIELFTFKYTSKRNQKPNLEELFIHWSYTVFIRGKKWKHPNRICGNVCIIKYHLALK